MHGVPAEAEPVQRRLAHVVDQRVGGGDQPPQYLLAGFLLQIDGERALVAVVVDEDGADAGCALRRDRPVHVAVDGLDLDDLGAQIAEDLRGEGTEDDGGDVDDAQAGEEGIHVVR